MSANIENAKKLYQKVKVKSDLLKMYYNDILKYEVVVEEYKKYNRDALNDIILNRMEEDSTELEELYDDFSDEVDDYIDELSDDDEEEEFWNDPILVYEAVKRNQKIMDSLFDSNKDAKEKNQVRKSRPEHRTLPREDSHVRSMDEFVEDSDVMNFDELN